MVSVELEALGCTSYCTFLATPDQRPCCVTTSGRMLVGRLRVTLAPHSLLAAAPRAAGTGGVPVKQILRPCLTALAAACAVALLTPNGAYAEEAFGTLRSSESVSTAHGVTKAKVTSRAEALTRHINSGRLKRARRIASAEVMDALKGRDVSVLECYKSTYEGDDFAYGGPLPWGCTIDAETDASYGVYGVGFKRIHGKWKARDLQFLASKAVVRERSSSDAPPLPALRKLARKVNQGKRSEARKFAKRSVVRKMFEARGEGVRFDRPLGDSCPYWEYGDSTADCSTALRKGGDVYGTAWFSMSNSSGRFRGVAVALAYGE